MFGQVIRCFLSLICLCVVLIFGNIGCGKDLIFGNGDNSQPVIEAIPDITLKANSQPVLEAISDMTIRAGIRFEVNLNITDADVDDTHTIWPSSSDRSIVELGSGFKGNILPIVGDSEGMTTISVYVKDDSGVSNAESTPVTFQVTVEPYVDKGFCAVGMTLEPGESCTYFVDQTEVVFSVNDDLGCLQTRLADRTLGGISLCASPDINRAGFRAEKINYNEKSWTIKRLP